jgi:purine-binding chemotaxis protein CheW
VNSLTILAGGTPHAVPLRDIAEIIRVPAAAPVPLAPAWLIGLINHRGAALPMVDLALLLGGRAATPTARSRVLVATLGVGFLIDDVAADALQNSQTLDLASLLPAAPRVAGRPAGQGARGADRLTAAEDHAHALLGFTVAGQEYAFALEHVEEVAACAADTVSGSSMVWRGQTLPAVPLRVLLGDADEAAAPARVIVVRLADGACVGMLVDAFSGILRVPSAQRHAVPPQLARGRAELESICRLDGGARLVCVLSPQRLMTPEGGTAFAPPPAVATISSHGAGGEPERFVVIRIGPARFAVPLAAVDEVLRATALSPVPGAHAVDGVRSLRGRVLPVIDLRRLASTGAERILVCSLGPAGSAGVLVDAVDRIVAVAPGDIEATPALLGAAAPLVTCVVTSPGGGLPLPVLDLPRLAGDRAAAALALSAHAGLAA